MPRTKKTATKRNPAPDWMRATPTIAYLLLAQTDQVEYPQELMLTVQEYESLKRHLASLRGYDVPGEEADA